MVERAALEMLCTVNRTQGSNPCLSAIYTEKPYRSRYGFSVIRKLGRGSVFLFECFCVLEEEIVIGDGDVVHLEDFEIGEGV